MFRKFLPSAIHCKSAYAYAAASTSSASASSFSLIRRSNRILMNQINSNSIHHKQFHSSNSTSSSSSSSPSSSNSGPSNKFPTLIDPRINGSYIHDELKLLRSDEIPIANDILKRFDTQYHVSTLVYTYHSISGVIDYNTLSIYALQLLNSLNLNESRSILLILISNPEPLTIVHYGTAFDIQSSLNDTNYIPKFHESLDINDFSSVLSSSANNKSGNHKTSISTAYTSSGNSSNSAASSAFSLIPSPSRIFSNRRSRQLSIIRQSLQFDFNTSASINSSIQRGEIIETLMKLDQELLIRSPILNKINENQRELNENIGLSRQDRLAKQLGPKMKILAQITFGLVIMSTVLAVYVWNKGENKSSANDKDNNKNNNNQPQPQQQQQVVRKPMENIQTQAQNAMKATANNNKPLAVNNNNNINDNTRNKNSEKSTPITQLPK